MKITIKSRPNSTKKGGEKRMKYSKIIIALVATGLALGTYVTSQADENVRLSKHNIASNANIGATGTTEVCVFCHTPHGGNTGVGGGAAPIWNRSLSTATYTMYKSPNFDVPFSAGAKPLGVSVACLSCHDGTIAFDALLNFPGSGSVNNIGLNKGTSRSDALGHMLNDAGNEFPNLTTDLSNDHPISMAIPCGTDPQFDELCANSTAATTGVTFLKRDTAYDTTNNIQLADKRNKIRAYPTGGDGTRYIECASCHNPHQYDAGGRFLRYPSIGDAKVTLPGTMTAAELDNNRNAGSLLCLSCHQK